MNSLQCQDEILQMMYWMRGEKIGDQVSAGQLNQFLRIDEDLLSVALMRLSNVGLVCATTDGCFALTERGVMEGGRRFMEEFSPLLGKEDHLSCSDPECDCQEPGWTGHCRSVELR